MNIKYCLELLQYGELNGIIQLLMKFKVLVLAAILSIAVSLLNYQQRIIYINENDNVCRYGQDSDLIWLNIDMDGTKSTRIAVWGKTGCSQHYELNSQRIIPVPYWTYIAFEDLYLQFKDEAIYKTKAGILMGIIQRTTIINPAKIQGEDYNCVINGDGEVHHFGFNFDGEAPAQIYLKCVREAATAEQQARLPSSLQLNTK